jgi:hypothetical protein
MQIDTSNYRLGQWLNSQANLAILRLSILIKSITWNWSTVR